MVNFVNLTPHPLTIEGAGTISPSGTVARVATVEKDAGTVAGVPLIKRTFGQVEGLPEPKDGTIYIVSSLVLSAVKNRPDVAAPDTGPTAIRDAEGRIQAVRRLVTN